MNCLRRACNKYFLHEVTSEIAHNSQLENAKSYFARQALKIKTNTTEKYY